MRSTWRFDTPERYQTSMKRYYRLITEVDEVVGRLVAELEAQKVLDETLIVFTSDNGYVQADRGLADKWYPYEASIRVPLVVRDPRLPRDRRGVTLDQMVLNIDVAPTIIAAAGQAVPAAMQGADLGPLYASAAAPAWRDEFFYEHPTVLGPDRIPASQAVVRRDWKYVEWPDVGYRQLFDLQADPGEVRNLAAEDGHAALVERFARALPAWRKRVR